MTARIVSRRAFVALALVCLAWLASDAAAQDPRGTAVQKAARDWLALTDRGDAQSSWAAAGKKFQNALTPDQWAASLKQARQPMGALSARGVLSTTFERSFPGAPDGEYALVVFRTSFAKKTDGRETVTLEYEPDGAWRVVGYFIR